MKTQKKILFLLLSIILRTAYAQENTVDILGITIKPPYGHEFGYYYDSRNVAILVSNKTATVQQFVLAGHIKGQNQNTPISLKLDKSEDQKEITLKPFITRYLTNSEIEGIFVENALTLSYPIEFFKNLNNRLPADCYDYELMAIRKTTGTVLGQEAYTEICINAIGQVQLTSPFNEENIVTPNVNFSWTTSEAPINKIEYVLQIVELLPNQDPNQAFQMGAFFAEKTIKNGTPIFQYQNLSPQFEKGKTYAWRIKQQEKNGATTEGYSFDNEGFSEVWTFTYGEEKTSQDFTITTIYPPNNTAIPFRNIPFIIKWEPYNANYEKFTANTILTNRNSAYPIVNEKYAVNNWKGKGPLEGQKEALKAANVDVNQMTEEDAQYMPVGPKGESLKIFNLYEQHRNVSWSVIVNMETKDVVTSEASVTNSFTAGMGKPILYDLDKNALKTGKNINFKFKTSEIPENLFPEKIVQSAQNGLLTKFEDFLVYEKCVVEISKDKNFTKGSIIQQAVGELIDVKNKKEWTELRDYVYKDLEVKFDLEPGNYFWRVKWLVNPSEVRDFTNSYSESDVQEFCVGENCSSPNPTITKTADCGGCKFGLPQNSDVATDYLKAGAVIKIGSSDGFQVKTINIDGSGNGMGILGINIYSLGSVNLGNNNSFNLGEIPMKVELNGVKVNSDGILVAGTIKSKKKEGVGLNLSTDFITANNPETYKSLQGDLIEKWNKVKQEIENLPKSAGTAINNAGYTTPLGFSEDISGVSTTIAFDDFEFTPTSNSFSAYAVIEDKEENIVIPFGLKGTCLGIKGACQDYTLFLAKDVPMSNFTLKGGTDIEKATHLVYSFNGPKKFQKIHIAAEYEFKDDILKPQNEADGKVKASFVVDSPNGFADWTATADITPFKVAGMEDFKFDLDGKATYDHSNKAQAEGMKAMLDALKDKVDEDGKNAITAMNNDTWKGFYLPKLKVTLPDIFKADQKENIDISVQNLIIDGTHGLTGSLNANNVFGIGDGNLDGWYYSLDNINLAFFNGSLVGGASAKGKIVLPISGNPNENATQIDYEMLLSQNSLTDKSLKYQFVLKPDKDVNVPIWKANMKLGATSNITISIGDKKTNNGKFLAKADLNGKIDFKTPEVGGVLPSYSLNLIKFEHFKLQSVSPYIDFGNTNSNIGEQIEKIGDEQYQKANNLISAFASPQKEVGGSPVSLDEISPIIQVRGDEVVTGFYIHGSLNLSDDIPLSPSAGLGMGVLANMKMEGGRPKFGFKGVEINDVSVKGVLGPVSVEGSLKFYRGDTDFGDGFKGEVAATFPMDIAVKGQAQFGSKNNFNYWSVYASLTGLSIPIGPQPIINITGFGGGAYHNMESSFVPSLTSLPNSEQPYLPKQESNGCLATVFVSGVQENLLKAQATFRVQWDGNGITQVGLDGDINLFNEENSPSARGVANGTLKVVYDFREDIFDLTGGVEANLLGNEIIVDGKNSLRIYIDKNTQFIQVGNPDPAQGKRVSLTVLKMLEGNAYFWAGNGAMPDIPLPYGIDLGTLQRMGYKSFKELGFTNASGGMMFGAYAGFPAGGKKDEELRFLIFYMKMHAGFGFDVQLARYTEPCGSSNKPPGMNGWYAMGQIYGSVGFAFGLHVDVWFFEGDIEAASVEATAIMQGGLPNPFWFKGMLNGKYSVLDGLISGDMNFKVSVGDVCIPNPLPTNPFKLPLISEIYPKEGKIDIFDNPSAIFNYPVGKEITITSTVMKKDGEGSETRIESFKIDIEMSTTRLSGADEESDCATNPDNSGELRISNDGLRATFYRNSTFVPDSKYELKVTGRPYMLKNGRWEIMKNEKTQAENTQVEKASFDTGPCPTKLPSAAIAITYPYQGQRFVLQKEFGNEGVIAFNKKLCCFAKDCGADKPYSLIMKFATEDNPQVELESPVSNNEGGELAQTLTFKLPNLPNEKFVRMRLVKKPNADYFKNKQLAFESNFGASKAKYTSPNLNTNNNYTGTFDSKLVITNIDSKNNTDYSGFEKYNNYNGTMGDATQKNSVSSLKVERNGNNQLEIVPKEIQVAEESYFRTSGFDTMNDKLIRLTNTAIGIENQEKGLLKLEIINAQFKSSEQFDRYEVGGLSVQIKGYTKYLEPILGWEFAKERSDWYRNEIVKFYEANQRAKFWHGRYFQFHDVNDNNIDGMIPSISINNPLEPFKLTDVPSKLWYFPVNLQPIKTYVPK